MTDSPRPRPGPGRPAPGARPAPAPTAAPAAAPTEADPVVTPRAPRRIGRIVTTVLAALVLIAFVVLNIWLAIDRSADADVENARIGAMKNARHRVPAMLSYNYKTVGTYLSASPRNTTGAFKKEFTQLITTVIGPAAKQQQIVTKATVKSAGVIEAHAETVVILVLIDQVTTSKDSKTGRVDGSRVRVTMTRRGGTWLVSRLTQI